MNAMVVPVPLLFPTRCAYSSTQPHGHNHSFPPSLPPRRTTMLLVRFASSVSPPVQLLYDTSLPGLVYLRA